MTVPHIEASYPQLLATLQRCHSQHAQLQKQRSAWDAIHPFCVALERLHTIDGYPESEIVDCLQWLLTSNHSDALWWRRNVVSFAGLRRQSKDSSKFYKIHQRWKDATDPHRDDPVTQAFDAVPNPPEEMPT